MRHQQNKDIIKYGAGFPAFQVLYLISIGLITSIYFIIKIYKKCKEGENLKNENFSR